MEKKAANHHRKHKIRGDLRPFQINSFCEIRKQILIGPLRIDDVMKYREIFKQLLADRLRVALIAIRFYEPLEGVDILLEALAARPKYSELGGFVSCCLEYFNNQAICEYHIVPPKAGQKPSWRRQKKLLTDAFKSICRASYIEMRPALKVLERYRSDVAPEQIEAVGKYRTISRAVSLLYLLFHFFYIQSLPSNLSVETFDRVWMVNRKLGDYYMLDGDIYRLSIHEKKPLALCIGTKAAMTLYTQLLPN